MEERLFWTSQHGSGVSIDVTVGRKSLGQKVNMASVCDYTDGMKHVILVREHMHVCLSYQFCHGWI